MYYLYIVQCLDTSFYTGITTDLKRRIKEHNTSVLGAKYTRGRSPVRLVYVKELADRSEASKEEDRIKSLTRIEKIILIKNARKEHLAKLKVEKKAKRGNYLKNKEEARDLITADIERINKHYNFEYNKIAIRDTKTRWGSCSKKKNLNFNYRLLHLSKEEREYVIIHELCHLKEMNHGQNFWALVAQVCPNYKTLRGQLRTPGRIL